MKNIYTAISATHRSQRDFEQFWMEYKRICSWIQMDFPGFSVPKTSQEQIEFIADCFHIHQSNRKIQLQEWDFLPRVSTGDVESSAPWLPKVNYKIACDSLRSAFNVGSIFRLVDAVGFESVIIGGTSPGKDHRHVIKASMGSAGWIPQEGATDLVKKLNQQKQVGYSLIGLETIANSLSYQEFKWPEKGIVVLGNEEYGLSNKVMHVCDEFVHLPMMGRKNSINVANAMAVVAFQITSSLCS